MPGHDRSTVVILMAVGVGLSGAGNPDDRDEADLILHHGKVVTVDRAF